MIWQCDVPKLWYSSRITIHSPSATWTGIPKYISIVEYCLTVNHSICYLNKKYPFQWIDFFKWSVKTLFLYNVKDNNNRNLQFEIVCT